MAISAHMLIKENMKREINCTLKVDKMLLAKVNP
jgi:hypothetical protein